MKKIINGKKYDTDTAKELGSWWNGYSKSDFGYCSQTLYRKKTGEYFLHGKGGAQTGYAKKYGNCYGYGEEIDPMSEAEARKWAEINLSGDEYESIFGEVEE